MVEAAGLEPTVSSTRNWRDTTFATPRNVKTIEFCCGQLCGQPRILTVFSELVKCKKSSVFKGFQHFCGGLVEQETTSTRTVKALYNKGFRVIFSAFVSEIGAFQGYPTHCVHTVQVRRWSKVWSEQIFTRTRAPNRESSSSFFLPIV